MTMTSHCKLSQCTHAKGFTLLELLIAVSLTAVLMTVLVVGLSLITRDWEKHGEHLDQALDESLLLLQMEKAILGAFPYKFKETSLAKEELFFAGASNELRWVSTVSPEHTSGLMLWHIKANEEGGMTVNVQAAYPGNLNKQLEKYQDKNPDSPVYFKDFKISFFYLSENSQKIKQWSQNWDSKDKRGLPIGVRMVFKKSDEQLASMEQSDIRNNYELFSFIRAGSGTAGRSSSFLDRDVQGGFLGK